MLTLAIPSLPAAGVAGAVRTADEQRVPVEQVMARVQAIARKWGLSARLVTSDERELAFDVTTAG